MNKDNASKVRLMKIVEILRQESDKEHPLTTNQLQESLLDIGIKCERHTLKNDVDSLIDMGYRINVERKGASNVFWSDECEFTTPEIKILIDAVQAAGFIPEKNTVELVNKIVALGRLQQADSIKQNQVRFNTRKHNNTHILNSVQIIEEALQSKEKISFNYFTYAGKKEKFYHNGGSRIIVEPLALIYLEDYYYLVCYDKSGDNHTKTYRIDRMEFTKRENEHISFAAIKAMHETDMSEYTKQVFKMFGGTEERVTLRFTKDIQDPVYDKFGTDVQVTEDGNYLQITIPVQISPTFWGWYFQFAGQEKMKIIKPDKVIQQAKEWLETVKNN